MALRNPSLSCKAADGFRLRLNPSYELLLGRRFLEKFHQRGADLTRTKLKGTNLRKANLYEARLDDARFEATAMPDGTINP